jgi:C-terminal processing protease CtpA/Prc
MKYILLLLFILACLISPITGFCQSLSKKEIESAITAIAKLIDDNYVFPEKGKRIATHLLQEYKKGEFSQIKDWKSFDSVVTKSLRNFSHDGHLYVRNDQKTVRELLAAKSQTANSSSREQFSYDPFYHGTEAIENNFGFREVKILEGNIGYIKLFEINISTTSLPVLFAAMDFTANTKALVIDLRDNGGGGSEVGSVFESFFLPKNVPLLEFKTRNGPSSIEKTVPWLTKKKYNNPLFIIVNNGTASAAEALAYSLQNKGRAKIIGQSSAGAANMNSWYVVNEQIFVSVSTAAPTLPGTEDSWEQKGIQPDHIVENGTEIEFIRKLVSDKER